MRLSEGTPDCEKVLIYENLGIVIGNATPVVYDSKAFTIEEEICVYEDLKIDSDRAESGISFSVVGNLKAFVVEEEISALEDLEIDSDRVEPGISPHAVGYS